MQNILILVAIILVVLFLSKDKIEGWATSPGTLLQLATSRPYYSSYAYMPYYGRNRMPFRRRRYRRYYNHRYRGIRSYPFPFW